MSEATTILTRAGHRQTGIDHGIDLCGLTALTDHRQTGAGGQVELRGLLDFETGHDQMGEGLGCGIVTNNQRTTLDL